AKLAGLVALHHALPVAGYALEHGIAKRIEALGPVEVGGVDLDRPDGDEVHRHGVLGDDRRRARAVRGRPENGLHRAVDPVDHTVAYGDVARHAHGPEHLSCPALLGDAADRARVAEVDVAR